jgi:hypothetical protein
MLKLQCNKCSTYIERPTPPLSKRRPHFETHVSKRIKILVTDLEKTEARNNCAGEDQHHLTKTENLVRTITLQETSSSEW